MVKSCNNSELKIDNDNPESNYKFADLFNLDEIQNLQDKFSAATGVAAIITEIDGTPITKPSNFCAFCDIVRKTEKGLNNCKTSDSIIGSAKKDGPIIQRCLSGGLIDGGVSIMVGERHLANWLVGQILDNEFDENEILAYTDEIGADRNKVLEALGYVTRMSRNQFSGIIEFLYLTAQQLSALAVKNLEQKMEISRRKLAEQEVLRLNTKLKNANALLEEELEKKELITNRLQKYKLLAENAHDAMLFFNHDGKILEVNDTALRIYGYTKDEFSHLSLFDLRCAESKANVIEQMEKADSGGVLFETTHSRKDGTCFNVEVSSKGASFDNRRVLLGIIRDISDRKKAEDENRFISYHDQLTGLHNRRYYEEELKRLDTGRNLPLSLILGDINGLKLTNDAFGHMAGDKLIQLAADCLNRECREGDILARIGGDEFIFVLPNTDETKAEKIVNRIVTSTSEKIVGNVILSISFGWATKNVADEKMSDIFSQAEDFMYRNKLFESNSMKNNTIRFIIKSLYKRYHYEQSHAENVSKLSKNLAQAYGLSADEVSKIEVAGLFHDIGKIGIDEKIIKKPGALSKNEWLEIKRHSEIGYQILSSVNEFSQTAAYVLAHHERWDGKGYPRGLKELEIPVASRIIAIVGAYDNMTHDSCYREALSVEEALIELRNGAGCQFDPDLINVFIEKVLGKSIE